MHFFFIHCTFFVRNTSLLTFSINMDKQASNSNKCIFSVLVRYFDEVKEEAAVEHYQFI